MKADLVFNKCIMNAYCVPDPVPNMRCIKYTIFKALTTVLKKGEQVTIQDV